jgi:hypothetical protein
MTFPVLSVWIRRQTMYRVPRIVSVVYLVACSMCLAAVAQAEDPVKFRYKRNPDEKLIYETLASVDQTQTVNGTDVKNEIKNREISVHTLMEVGEDGNFKVQSENKRLVSNMKISPLGQYKFDSKSSNNENEKGSRLGGALTPLYELLSGAFTTFVQSPRGTVLKVEGLTELLADVIKSDPITAQFGTGATDKGAIANYNQLVIHFPMKAIKPGDAWTEPFEMDLPNIGKIKGETTYTYEGAGKVNDRKTAKFTATTEISVDIDIKMGQADVTGSISATESTGTIHFDQDKGRIVLLTSTMKMEGDMSVEAGGMTFNITLNQTQKLTKKLLDKLPE